MTAATTTLAAWLLEQIAADEAVARAAERRVKRWTEADPPWVIAAAASAQGLGPLEDLAAMANPARVLAVCEAHRRIVELHQNWPVLVETQPTFEPIDSADPSSFAMRASQQIAWLTEQEYRVRFGTEPPAAPMLRALAAIYADRDGFREEWR